MFLVALGGCYVNLSVFTVGVSTATAFSETSVIEFSET